MSLKERELSNWRLIELKATRGPWKWWTSNSWKRLMGPDVSATGLPMTRTPSVLEPYVSRADGHPDLHISFEDMEFITMARDALPILIDEVMRLRNVIKTGGALYRAERASMHIPGGHDEPVKLEDAFERKCDKCSQRFGDHIVRQPGDGGLECPDPSKLIA